MFGFTLKRRIVRHRKPPERKAKILFEDGQSVVIKDRTFSIAAVDAQTNYSKAKIQGDTVIVTLPEGLDGRVRKKHISNLSRRAISKALLPAVEKRVTELNDLHFRSKINRVTLKDTSSMWASCSVRNNINLDFRLLLAPPHIMDAIIVHELAHTVQRNHSKAFWSLVTNAMPDYKQRREWLRENAASLKPNIEAKHL